MNRKVNANSRNPKIIGIWIVFMLLFITELMLYTWSRVQCVRFGYELSEVTERRAGLTLLQKNLKIEIASLKSPNRIAKIAKEHLKLTDPKPEQLIVIP